MHPMMALDLFAHELDILHALGNPPPADHPAYPSALDSAVAGFSRELRVRELPSLRIESYGAHWVAGTGTPDVTLNADRHDLFRTLTGRRTKEQIASLSWDGAPDRWIPAFEWGLFIPPARPIEDVVGGR